MNFKILAYPQQSTYTKKTGNRTTISIHHITGPDNVQRELSTGQLIARGGTGRIREARQRNLTSQHFVPPLIAKIIRTLKTRRDIEHANQFKRYYSTTPYERTRELLINEYEILQKLQGSPYVPRVYGYSERNIPRQGSTPPHKKCYLFMERIREVRDEYRTKYHSLEDIMGRLRLYKKSLKPNDRKRALELTQHLFAQMWEVVEWLHQQGVSHGDINEFNFMFDENWNIKIIDFGSATTQPTNTSAWGTQGYRSPQKLCGLEYNSREEDLFSLGVSFIHMITNKHILDMHPVKNATPKDLQRIEENLRQTLKNYKTAFPEDTDIIDYLFNLPNHTTYPQPLIESLKLDDETLQRYRRKLGF